jgi:hypothetical protein
MMLRFDHSHYVPVLRFKRSEKVALRELGNQARAGNKSKRRLLAVIIGCGPLLLPKKHPPDETKRLLK